MKAKIAVLAALICAGMAPARAADQGPMIYAEFAAKVPHVDLTECPAVIPAPDADCHVATIEGTLYVLAFARTGDRPLVAVRSEAGDRDAQDFRFGRPE